MAYLRPILVALLVALALVLTAVPASADPDALSGTFDFVGNVTWED